MMGTCRRPRLRLFLGLSRYNLVQREANLSNTNMHTQVIYMWKNTQFTLQQFPQRFFFSPSFFYHLSMPLVEVSPEPLPPFGRWFICRVTRTHTHLLIK